MHLLITRPLHQAKRTALALHQLGHSSIIEPMIEIEQLNPQIPDQKYNGIILTSANALQALGTNWPQNDRKNIPILTTGETTANQAITLGFTNCENVQGSALDLVSSVKQWTKKHQVFGEASLLYPCAQRVAHDLEKLLKPQGITLHPWITYRSIGVKSLSTKTKTAFSENTLDGVLLYSPRTAISFKNLYSTLPKGEKKLHIFALSADICASMHNSDDFICHFADRPNESSLFELIQNMA